MYRRLRRWALPRKRSRDHLHSPDPRYTEKLLDLGVARLDAACSPHTHVFLYADEFTYYRQPEPGMTYWERGSGGHCQPLAHRSPLCNTHRRIIAALDAQTGRVVSYQAATLRHDKLIRFLHRVRAAYGPEVAITLAWDNWPNHHLDGVRAAADAARITLLSLPTYAPWTNPIEKLWDKLKENILRLHPWSGQWKELCQQVTTWLAQLEYGSFALLRSSGLLPDEEESPVWV